MLQYHAGCICRLAAATCLVQVLASIVLTNCLIKHSFRYQHCIVSGRGNCHTPSVGHFGAQRICHHFFCQLAYCSSDCLVSAGFMASLAAAKWRAQTWVAPYTHSRNIQYYAVCQDRTTAVAIIRDQMRPGQRCVHKLQPLSLLIINSNIDGTRSNACKDGGKMCWRLRPG